MVFEAGKFWIFLIERVEAHDELEDVVVEQVGLELALLLSDQLGLGLGPAVLVRGGLCELRGFTYLSVAVVASPRCGVHYYNI